MYIKRTEKEIIEWLETFTTCDISDGLLNLYKIPNGGFIPNLKSSSVIKTGKKSVAGRSYTVTYVTVDNSSYVNESTVNYIDKIPADSILVSGFTEELQLRTSPYVKPITAIFGGLNAQRARYLQCRGAVVLARVRDISELQQMGFPVYSYGTSTCSSNSNLRPVRTGDTLKILTSEGGKINVNSGDIIIMDENGVVCIPCTTEIDFDRLIDYIEKSIKVDELISNDLKEGKCLKSSKAERRETLKAYE